NDSIFQDVFGKEAVSISWTASKSSISICLTTCSFPSNFFPPQISSNIPAPGNEYLLFPVKLKTAQQYGCAAQRGHNLPHWSLSSPVHPIKCHMNMRKIT